MTRIRTIFGTDFANFKYLETTLQIVNGTRMQLRSIGGITDILNETISS
jgi:hypothetical protein